MGKSILKKNTDFFNKNFSIYGKHGLGQISQLDLLKLEFLSEYKDSYKKFIDIGGGGGMFIEKLAEYNPNFKLFLLDPSKNLLNQNQNPKITKIVGSLPNNIPKEGFDIVNLNRVIHHVVEKTIIASKRIVKISFVNLNNILEKDGILIIHEIFYESFLYETLTRSILFYVLKIQNFFKIKLPLKEFLLGLNVLFYSRNELFEFFKDSNFEIIFIRSISWKKRLIFKLGLVKNVGDILIIAKKK